LAVFSIIIAQAVATDNVVTVFSSAQMDWEGLGWFFVGQKVRHILRK
jgi:hypothetical protein